jgi:hypothetical protein
MNNKPKPDLSLNDRLDDALRGIELKESMRALAARLDAMELRVEDTATAIQIQAALERITALEKAIVGLTVTKVCATQVQAIIASGN